MKITFFISERHNPNYLAEIVEITNVRKHPNADALELVTIYGNDIVVAKDSVKIGDIMMYCPVESALSASFLKCNNQFRDVEMNSNKEIKGGFFEHHGRVKAVKLRDIPSTGFLFPPEWLQKWGKEMHGDFPDSTCWSDYKGITFDTFCGMELIKKYVPKTNPKSIKERDGKSRYNKRLKRFDRLVEGQFNFHIDTSHFERNLEKIEPNDILSITSKVHGTSGVFSYVLVNRELSLFERFLKWCGVKIQDKMYDYIWSSRKIIKNRYINKSKFVKSYYESDLYGDAFEVVKPYLQKGMTIYAEIVGYETGLNKFIQSQHDFGCREGEFKIKIYRITQTNEDGVVHEFSAKQVQDWCKLKGLTPVTELYYGFAKDIYPDISPDENWQMNLLERLQKDKERFFMECRDPECVNGVPFEGLVIRKETLGIQPFKLKTKWHYLWASKKADEGEIDAEDLQTEDE